jgi:hypothetical protein
MHSSDPLRFRFIMGCAASSTTTQQLAHALESPPSPPAESPSHVKNPVPPLITPSMPQEEKMPDVLVPEGHLPIYDYSSWPHRVISAAPHCLRPNIFHELGDSYEELPKSGRGQKNVTNPCEWCLSVKEWKELVVRKRYRTLLSSPLPKSLRTLCPFLTMTLLSSTL